MKEGKALEKRAEEESNLESSSDHSGGTSSRKRKIFERKISIKKNKGNEVSLEEEDNLRLSPALPSDEDEGMEFYLTTTFVMFIILLFKKNTCA